MSRSRSPPARQASEPKPLSIIVVYDSPRHHPIAARFRVRGGDGFEFESEAFSIATVTTDVVAEFEAEVREFFVRKHGIGEEVMERCGLQVWRGAVFKWAPMRPSRVGTGGKPNTLKTYRIAEGQTLRMVDETEDWSDSWRLE